MTFNNLTLYSTSAVLILDTDGNRVIAKYYQPPHAASFLSTATPAQQNAVASTTPQLSAKNPLSTLKDQRAFEKAIFDKTKRATGDIILYDSHLVLFKASLDVIFYVVGPAAENELMLSGLLSAFYDATSMLVRHQVEKRAILENLDLVTLALDETVDDGIILETDSTTIASRVSRPRPDVNEIQINEQSKLFTPSLRQGGSCRLQQSIGADGGAFVCRGAQGILSSLFRSLTSFHPLLSISRAMLN